MIKIIGVDMRERDAKNLAIVVAVAFAFFMILQRIAFALPSGYSADSGEVTFEQVTDKTLNINASHNSIIHYNSFSIAADETVNFSLPSIDSFSLNRVLGTETSQILGKLNANGNLILVNSNGFYFGPQAHITTGGLIASTHNISNANFLAGRYIFAGMGSSVSSSKSFIRNDGRIETRSGGMAVLVADAIDNRGVIEAPLGMVALAAGNVVTVGISYDGLISVGIDEPTAHMILDVDGNPITDQIKNSGLLHANGGQVLMNAQAVHHVFANSMNLSGTVRANTVQVGKDGVVEIVASGHIKVEGTYEAAGGRVDFESGTSIGVTGETVTKGDTTFTAKEDIVVNANVTTDSGTLIFHADSDLNGSGAFLQAAGTTIKTITFGDIKIYSSGESTLGNVISAGGLYLYQAGAPVKYTQYPGSMVVAGDSIHINEGVSLKAANTVYEVATDWVNQGAFAPEASSVKLVGPSHSVVYGDNTFNNFEVIEPEKTVSFEAGKTQEIVGVLTLKGTNGKLLVLRSTQPLIPWIIKPTGPTDVAFVDLQDSTNVNIHGPPALAAHSLNSLGNAGWAFSDVVFLGSHSVLWSDPANWDGGFLPGAGSVVKFSSHSSDSLVDGSYTVSSLVLDSSYVSKVTLGGDLTVSGDVTLAGGVLAGGSHTLTVGGNWSAVGGHFDAGTSTVVFNDASKASTIYGSTTFYNFTSLTPSKKLYFEAGATQTVMGALTLVGDPGVDHGMPIEIHSTDPGGVQWKLDPRGEVTVKYVFIGDTWNLSLEPIKAIPSNSYGNNTNIDTDPVWDNSSANGLWSTAANWDTNVVPISTDTVTFNDTSNTNSLVDAGFAGTIAILDISAGYTSTVTLGRALIVTGAVTVSSGTYDSSTFNTTVGGLVTINGGTYNIGTGKSTFNGGLTLSSGTITSGGYSASSVSFGFTTLTGSATDVGLLFDDSSTGAITRERAMEPGRKERAPETGSYGRDLLFPLVRRRHSSPA